MLHRPATEKTTMVQPLTVEDFKTNPEVKKTRRSLIIVLSIQLVLTAIFFYQLIVLTASHNSIKHASAETSPINTDEFKLGVGILIMSGILTLIYLIGYIIAVVKYNRTVILILAWITMVILVLGFFIEISDIIKLSTTTNELVHQTDKFVVSIIEITIDLILLMLAIVFSFKLVKLIEKQTDNQIV